MQFKTKTGLLVDIPNADVVKAAAEILGSDPSTVAEVRNDFMKEVAELRKGIATAIQTLEKTSCGIRD